MHKHLKADDKLFPENIEQIMISSLQLIPNGNLPSAF